MGTIPQAGIKPAGLPLWGTVVCTPDAIMLFTVNSLFLVFSIRKNMLDIGYFGVEFNAFSPRLALHEGRCLTYRAFNKMPLTQLLALVRAHFIIQMI